MEFAKKVISEVRDGTTKERQHTGRAFALRCFTKTGKEAEAFAWATFNRYRWEDDGDKETLKIAFAGALVTITGRHLDKLMDGIDEEHLKAIQEHNATEAAILIAENPEKKPVIVSIEIKPPFEELEASYENRPLEG